LPAKKGKKKLKKTAKPKVAKKTKRKPSLKEIEELKTQVARLNAELSKSVPITRFNALRSRLLAKIKMFNVKRFETEALRRRVSALQSTIETLKKELKTAEQNA
jgi:polyhydroxyalkanoate synthesis regulator phasin